MHLGELLGLYIPWADRRVYPRPRTVGTWDGFYRNDKVIEYSSVIYEFASKIERGEDLTPYLSDSILEKGYSRPKKTKDGKIRGKNWLHKDYALNCYETHHFHLNTKIRKDGWSVRTRDLLYVVFGRDTAFFIMVGDHKSFDDGSLMDAVAEIRAEQGIDELNGILPPKEEDEFSLKEKNLLQRHGGTTMFCKNGKVIIGPVIATDGTSLIYCDYASEVRYMIYKYDPMLDDRNYQEKLFYPANKPVPNTPQFEWVLNYCDLLLFEKRTQTYFEFLQWRR